jgi:hypothetical protein
MADEVTTTNEVKTASDGSVKISVEKYNELLEKSAAKPPVVNRTTVIKTNEMGLALLDHALIASSADHGERGLDGHNSSPSLQLGSHYMP